MAEFFSAEWYKEKLEKDRSAGYTRDVAQDLSALGFKSSGEAAVSYYDEALKMKALLGTQPHDIAKDALEAAVTVERDLHDRQRSKYYWELMRAQASLIQNESDPAYKHAKETFEAAYSNYLQRGRSGSQ